MSEENSPEVPTQDVGTKQLRFWRQPIRWLYEWVLSWAKSPFGAWALFILAFAESSFFPIPPDILLIALGISIPIKSFRYALICSVGSLLGGCFGYFIGVQLYETIGQPIIDFYQIQESFHKVQALYVDNVFISVSIAGFTPIPYKVFTIAAGVCRVDFLIFILASGLSRSARFFLVSTLVFFYGAQAKTFIDKYFNLLTILFVLLLILGFVILKWLVA